MKILLGLDTSSMAPRLVEATAVFASKLGATLELMRAVEPPFELEAMPVPPSFGQVLENMLEEADGDLHALAAQAPNASAIARSAKLGVAWSVLCEEAKGSHADVLCVGAHGYSPTQRILGTAAACVADRAPCSVLLLRPSRPQIEHIVVGLDDSPLLQHVLARAVAFAELFDTDLTLVGAVPLPVSQNDEATLDEVAKQKLELASARIKKVHDGISAKLRISTEVALGAPWEVLCDVASTRNAQLVVIGAHSHRLLDGLLGTTATKVANHAPCSVFIVREQN